MTQAPQKNQLSSPKQHRLGQHHPVRPGPPNFDRRKPGYTSSPGRIVPTEQKTHPRTADKPPTQRYNPRRENISKAGSEHDSRLAEGLQS
jgi:hypothetical protein